MRKVPYEQRDIAMKAYESDILRISKYIEKTILGKDFQLSLSFLLGLHKNLYPEGFMQMKQDKDGTPYVWMIPGELRKIKIIPSDSLGQDIYTPYDDIEECIGKLIQEFNSKLQSGNNAFHSIVLFAIDLVMIHPFGDGNGRLCNILLDVLLWKYGHEPLGLHGLKEHHKQNLYDAVTGVFDTRDVDEFMITINKIRGETNNENVIV